MIVKYTYHDGCLRILRGQQYKYVPTKADSLRKGGRMPRPKIVEGGIGFFPPDMPVPPGVVN